HGPAVAPPGPELVRLRLLQARDGEAPGEAPQGLEVLALDHRARGAALVGQRGLALLVQRGEAGRSRGRPSPVVACVHVIWKARLADHGLLLPRGIPLRGLSKPRATRAPKPARPPPPSARGAAHSPSSSYRGSSARPGAPPTCGSCSPRTPGTSSRCSASRSLRARRPGTGSRGGTPAPRTRTPPS